MRVYIRFLDRASFNMRPSIIGEHCCSREGSIGRGKSCPKVHTSLWRVLGMRGEFVTVQDRPGLNTGNNTAPLVQKFDAHPPAFVSKVAVTFYPSLARKESMPG